MKRILRLILLLLVVQHNVYGQESESETWYNVVTVPPSPNAASLGQYGEIAVNKVNGLPNVSVPIVNIQSGSLSLPISLSYNAGGRKVEERASWVGLGWSLNAGGVITRTMRGLPDEDVNGFFGNADRVPNASQVTNELSANAKQETAFNTLEKMNQGTEDFEPDAFFYNFGPHSGSFYFGNNRQAYPIPYENLKIDYIVKDEKIHEWRIITPDGKLYTFGGDNAVESTFVEMKGPDQPEYTSSWYLTSIVDLNTNDVIVFEYQTSGDFTMTYQHSTTKVYEARNAVQMESYGQLQENKSSVNILSPRMLKRIVFANGEVNFESSGAVGTPAKLDRLSWTNGNLERSFSFTYDYFKSGGTDPDDPDANRLKLLSFHEEIEGEAVKHAFSYNETALPRMDSKAQDHWGYYNGETTNPNLIGAFQWGEQTLGYANREPSAEYVQACMLEKITYPTGGTSELIMEPHTYQELLNAGDVPDTQHDVFARVNDPAYSVTDEVTFTFGSNLEPAQATISITATLEEGSEDFHDQVKYTFYDLTTSTILKSGSAEIDRPVDEEVSLVPGHEYQLALEAESTFNVVSGSGAITYQAFTTEQSNQYVERIAGGLRVQQIINTDPYTGKQTFKTYEYGPYGGYLLSSKPRYYSETKVISDSNPYEYDRLMAYSSPVAGLGASSSSVAYQEVTEYFGTQETNSGKVITYYQTSKDGGHSARPYPPKVSYQWHRSKERAVEVYESFPSGDTLDYKLKKKVENQYVYDTTHSYVIEAFKASKQRDYDGIILRNFDYFINTYAYENYRHYSKWYKLDKSTTYSYEGDDEPMIAITKYQYDSPIHMQVSKILTVNSKGEEIVTEMKYPLDYSQVNYTCEAQFDSDIQSCTNQLVECAQELNECELKYSSCYRQYLYKLSVKEDWKQENCTKTTISLGAVSFTFRGVSATCIQKADKKFPLQNEMNECLESEGYQACMDAVSCGYVPCKIKAYNSYQQCKASYYSALLDEFKDAPLEDKAVHWMNLLDIHNRVIEKTVSVNGKQVARYKSNYQLTPDSLVVMASAQQAFEDDELRTALTYDAYDSRGRIMQLTNKGNGFAKSYIWGYHGAYPVAEILNARVNHTAYTSFESSNSGNWTFNNAQVVTGEAVTGKNYLNLLENDSVSMPSLPAGEYTITFYAKGNVSVITDYEALGEVTYPYQPSVRSLPNDWALYEYTISSANQMNDIVLKSSGAQIDELRLLPSGAQMSTFTYEPGVGKLTETDANNQTVYYHYDAAGRLEYLTDFEGNLIKKFQYHYQQI